MVDRQNNLLIVGAVLFGNAYHFRHVVSPVVEQCQAASSYLIIEGEVNLCLNVRDYHQTVWKSRHGNHHNVFGSIYNPLMRLHYEGPARLDAAHLPRYAAEGP